jgi:8-oxo-dGTP diphosphatase
MRYVVGLAFSPDFKRVALIRKTRPEWQRGRLNGIGGKVERDETPVAAMRREFREEAGVDTQERDWTHKLTLSSPSEGWAVDFFATALGDPVLLHTTNQTGEIEEVIVCFVDDLPEAVLPNLRWIVPLCLDGDVAFGSVFEAKAGSVGIGAPGLRSTLHREAIEQGDDPLLRAVAAHETW